MLSIVPVKRKSLKFTCFIILLVVAFITPLYHYHDSAEVHHDDGSSDHCLAAGSASEEMHVDISDGHSHIDPHLHFLGNIDMSGKTRDWQNRIKKGPVFNECLNIAYGAEVAHSIFEIRITITKSGYFRNLSGLSPPVV